MDQRANSGRSIGFFLAAVAGVALLAALIPLMSGAESARDPEARAVADRFVDAVLSGDETVAFELANAQGVRARFLSNIIDDLNEGNARLISDGEFVENPDNGHGPYWRYELAIDDAPGASTPRLTVGVVATADGRWIVESFGLAANEGWETADPLGSLP
jgi:hypothetical protein